MPRNKTEQWSVSGQGLKVPDNDLSQKLIADIILFYNTTWTHAALKMKPQAARAAGINWRARGSVIAAAISNNLIWAPQPPYIILHFTFAISRISHSCILSD
jgi:hypothetical protein